MESSPGATVRALSEQLTRGAARVLVGQEETFRLLTVALLVGGHTLLEGVPGTAKTLMAKTLATLAGGTFRRVQFTPDLMPSDITGTNVFDLQSGQFTLRRGPVFTDVLLGDEINRAPAKTQSALLEAMEERQVTIDGEPYPLSSLFTVIATQNPIEFEGTYPLPEAQLDRFLFKLIVSYTPYAAETELLRRVHAGFDAHALERSGLAAVTEPAHILACRRLVQEITVDEAIIGYIEAIVWTTRQVPDLLLGASPRAAIALLQGAKALAALDGRAYVVPDDVKALAAPVLRHRLIVRPEAELAGITAEVVIGRVLGSVPIPR
ncbi:MAG: AAA family ATPase [Thermomicrobiales bacterium]